ncbi:carbohydrate binding domain-containing protein [Lactiplantibacillus plantarum]|uniref:carbohydrate binding domain-containing protein n=1 Tax=Lactiplantibacillus plantarum TaxID=1590 RepID=UPI00264896D2|nr:carbohydrate binding domain-containing protein [Lactiplantibacillus plantarum]MCG0687717.1 Serine-rich adhesin [Lactiplantibacillus plantarum]MDR4072016.1 phage tail protein [Lactiplantibacillus plantarum]WGS68512.1 phage tail protein [Lactiplantibacillus plantarum]
MAESNATQVILTDDGIKIINAQNTADNAASQAGNADSAALIAQSTANAAKSAADSNYNYANSEVAVQSNATAKAQSTADNAFSQAQAVGSQASAEISNNSTATAKAQSTADNAFSQATTAIDNGKVTSQAVTDLKDGSKLTIADLENGLATKVANSDYASYKVQTASQIAQKVDNGAFSAYQTTTADLIAQKVATKDFSAYQATTAKSIDSKVSSNDFNTYKTQTADLIDDKVSSSEYASDKTQTASEIADRVSNSAFSTYQTQTASQIASKVDNGAFSAYQTTTADLIAQKVATSDFSAYQATTAKEISSKVESSDFKTYQTQTADMIASKVSKKDANNVNLIPYSSHFTTPLTGWTLMDWGATDRKLLVTTHNFYQNGTGALLYLNTAQNGTAAAGSNRFPLSPNTTYTFQFKAFASSNVVGANVYLLTRTYGSTNDYDIVHGLFTNLVTSPSHIDQYTVTFTTGANDNEGYIRVDNIGSNNSASSGLFFTELKLELGGVATPYVYGGQDSMISQMSDDINLRVTKDGLIDQINIQAGNTLISSSGQLTLAADTIYFDTKKPVIISNANITDTLNGKTFHDGDIINDANNTSNFYPFTIEPTGKASTTLFNSMDALRTEMSGGGLRTMYRAINSSGSQYEAYDGNFSGDIISLNSGFTNGKDMSFSQSVSGNQLTGQVVLSPLNGIHLWGSTQSIHFSGLQMNGTGISFNSYGNIIADQASTWWRVTNFSGSDIANFGTDTAGSNVIQFNRELDIGNFQINTGHTFTSADNQAIHFAKGKGGTVDIYAGAVHYNSLVKSSLLSVKKDVQRADTAYWAQLVNSIDLATYQYKSDDNTSHIRLSSIVDDVNDTKQWRLPDVFVSRDENGKLNGVDDSVLLNATLATVQEQQKEIDQLNGHNMELEARLNKLEAKLNG